MTDSAKIKPVHTQRAAFVYIRQSSPSQVENNRESTARQYALVDRACELGWPREQVTVIDEDLGISGASVANRSGFTRMISEVALGRAGIVLGLGSLATGAQQCRLVSSAGPLRHDRHVDRRQRWSLSSGAVQRSPGARPERHHERSRTAYHSRAAGRRHPQQGRSGRTAPRPAGRLRVGRAGWRGAVSSRRSRHRRHPHRVRSLRRIRVRTEGVAVVPRRRPAASFATGRTAGAIRWVAPTYTAIHHILTNPVYAGAYVYGKTKHERYVDEEGNLRKRTRHLPIGEWAVLLPEHHPGFIDWATYQPIKTASTVTRIQNLIREAAR